jgi:hypothetical protein
MFVIVTERHRGSSPKNIGLINKSLQCLGSFGPQLGPVYLGLVVGYVLLVDVTSKPLDARVQDDVGHDECCTDRNVDIGPLRRHVSSRGLPTKAKDTIRCEK